jgi:hypothetical protein
MGQLLKKNIDKKYSWFVPQNLYDSQIFSFSTVPNWEFLD